MNFVMQIQVSQKLMISPLAEGPPLSLKNFFFSVLFSSLDNECNDFNRVIRYYLLPLTLENHISIFREMPNCTENLCRFLSENANEYSKSGSRGPSEQFTNQHKPKRKLSSPYSLSLNNFIIYHTIDRSLSE